MNRKRAALGTVLLALGPGIWFLHLSLTYAFVPEVCQLGNALPFHALSVVAVVGLVVTTVVAYRALPDRRDVRRWTLAPSVGPRGQERERPVLFVLSALLAAYFLVVVVLTWLVPIVLHRCA